MTPLEMIAEWRKGCTVSLGGPPEECTECTVGLIDAMERALTWQPIKTAPKDGTVVLLYPSFSVVSNIPRMGSWSDDWQSWYHFEVGHLNGHWHPTHWMPLPEPPK